MKKTIATLIKQLEKANDDYALHNNDMELFSNSYLNELKRFKKLIKVAKTGNRLYAEKFGRNAISNNIRYMLEIA